MNHRQNTQPGQAENKFKRGTCFSFKADSLTYTAVVLSETLHDTDGVWYGLHFTNYASGKKPTVEALRAQKVFGRKVESTLNEKGYEICLDIEYVNEVMLSENFSPVGELNLLDNFKTGSKSFPTSITEFRNRFKQGLVRRNSPPDSYKDWSRNHTDFRPDQFFDLRDFIER